MGDKSKPKTLMTRGNKSVQIDQGSVKFMEKSGWSVSGSARTKDLKQESNPKQESTEQPSKWKNQKLNICNIEN